MYKDSETFMNFNVNVRNPNLKEAIMAKFCVYNLMIALAAIFTLTACGEPSAKDEPSKAFVDVYAHCNPVDAGMDDSGGDVPPGDALPAPTVTSCNDVMIALSLDREGVTEVDIVSTTARGGILNKSGVCRIGFEEGEDLGDETLHPDVYDIVPVNVPEGYELRDIGGIDAPRKVELGKNGESTVKVCLQLTPEGAADKAVKELEETLPPKTATAVDTILNEGSVCIPASAHGMNGSNADDCVFTMHGVETMSSDATRPDECPPEALYLDKVRIGKHVFAATCGDNAGSVTLDVQANRLNTADITLYPFVPVDDICVLSPTYWVAPNANPATQGDKVQLDLQNQFGRGVEGSCSVKALTDEDRASGRITFKDNSDDLLDLAYKPDSGEKVAPVNGVLLHLRIESSSADLKAMDDSAGFVDAVFETAGESLTFRLNLGNQPATTGDPNP